MWYLNKHTVKCGNLKPKGIDIGRASSVIVILVPPVISGVTTYAMDCP